MKEFEKNKTMTPEEKLLDPSISDEMREFIRFVANKPFSQLMPRKHELVLTDLVRMDTVKLQEENPNMPIKKVITTIFEPLTDDIPAPLMLKLTQIIIDLWAERSAAAQKDESLVLAA